MYKQNNKEGARGKISVLSTDEIPSEVVALSHGSGLPLLEFLPYTVRSVLSEIQRGKLRPKAQQQACAPDGPEDP